MIVVPEKRVNGEPFSIRFTVDAFRDMLREQIGRGLQPVACLVSPFDRRALVDDMHATATEAPQPDDADKAGQLILILEGCRVLEHRDVKRGEVRLYCQKPQGALQKDADKPLDPDDVRVRQIH